MVILGHKSLLSTYGANEQLGDQICPKIGIFGQFGPISVQKQQKQGAQVVFRYVGTKTFTSSQKKIGKRPNSAIQMTFLAKYWHLWPIWFHNVNSVNSVNN